MFIFLSFDPFLLLAKVLCELLIGPKELDIILNLCLVVLHDYLNFNIQLTDIVSLSSEGSQKELNLLSLALPGKGWIEFLCRYRFLLSCH
jgi:hypothetical protein